MKGDQHSF